jgi:hypothetical protein
MQTSPNISAIADALAKAQGELENVTKDRENPHFKSTYATLAAVLDVCRPVLSKHGIAIIQAPANDEGGRVSITTRLLHSSGEWLQCTVAVRASKDDAQGIGSVVSYLRRYSLAAMVGVAQQDDDGNAGSNGNHRDERQPDRQPDRQEPRQPEPQKLDAKGHDASWTDAERVKFCSALTSILGLKYEDVSQYALDTKRPKPSAMTLADRQALFNELDSVAGVERWKKWLVWSDLQFCKANLATLAFPPSMAELDAMTVPEVGQLRRDIEAEQKAIAKGGKTAVAADDPIGF